MLSNVVHRNGREELLIILAGPGSVPDGDPQRTALLRRILDGRRMLLVLDDVPDAELVRPLLWCGWSMTIITSRRQLVDLDATWHRNLEPLDADAGANLLARAAGRDLRDEDRRAAARIVVACGGLPLGLRIAASRLVLCPGTSLSQLAGQLGEESTMLDELAVGDASIRGRLSHEHTSLHAGDQRVLSALACDSGGCVEVPCTVGAGGATPSVIGPMPPQLVALNRTSPGRLPAVRGPDHAMCDPMVLPWLGRPVRFPHVNRAAGLGTRGHRSGAAQRRSGV